MDLFRASPMSCPEPRRSSDMVAVPEIRVLQDSEELAREGADLFAWIGSQAHARAGRFKVCLTGGTTPRRMYEALATLYEERRLDVRDVEFYFGDERCVPPDDPASNYRLARDTLFRPLKILETQTFRMHGEVDPEQAAREYETLLQDRLGQGGWPRFDLLLLGLGDDAHVASLFPGAPSLQECRRAVMATLGPREPRRRISITIPVINHADMVMFLVSGPQKAQAVRRTIDRTGPPDPQVPATFVRPLHGRLLWFLDRAAAAELALAKQSVVSHEE
jgi:6-phosphogluconolactonase